MAAFIPTPNCWRLTFVGTLAGKTITFGLALNSNGQATTPALALVATAAVAWFETWRAVFPTHFTLTLVRVTDVSTQNGVQFEYSVTSNNVGTLVGPALPNNCAIVVTLRTAFIGRSFRGRMYLPCLNEQTVDFNVITSAHRINVEAAIAALRLALDLLNTNPAIQSLATNKVPRTTGVLTNVTSHIVRTRVDTQRRRLPKE